MRDLAFSWGSEDDHLRGEFCGVDATTFKESNIYLPFATIPQIDHPIFNLEYRRNDHTHLVMFLISFD